MSQNEIKEQLIDLYLYLKIRKAEDIENLTKEDIETEKDVLKVLSSKDIINYIRNTIETLIDIKVHEKYEEILLNEESKQYYHNNEDKNDENGLMLYEDMLRKAEKDIRKHIRVNIYKLFNFVILGRTRIKITTRRY